MRDGEGDEAQLGRTKFYARRAALLTVNSATCRIGPRNAAPRRRLLSPSFSRSSRFRGGPRGAPGGRASGPPHSTPEPPLVREAQGTATVPRLVVCMKRLVSTGGSRLEHNHGSSDLLGQPPSGRCGWDGRGSTFHFRSLPARHEASGRGSLGRSPPRTRLSWSVCDAPTAAFCSGL